MRKVRRFVRGGEQSLQPNLLQGSAPKLVLGMLLACVVISLGACQKTEVKPLDIAENDTCFRCRGPIADKHYAAELVTKDGFVRKFDDLGCMLEHATEKIGTTNIIAYFVMDFPTQQWVKAEDAHFVKSDKFQTPRNGGILAFKDPAKAQALAAQYQAPVITFADLIK
jgi:copper chaperone NosL